MANKATKFYNAVFASIQTKKPKNIDAKCELDSTGFARPDGCLSVPNNLYDLPKRKTKVE
jgi:hypothetical protein